MTRVLCRSVFQKDAIEITFALIWVKKYRKTFVSSDTNQEGNILEDIQRGHKHHS